MASSYLSKSASSGNSTTFTISVWIKRLITGTATQMFNAHKADSIAGHTNFGIDSNDRLDFSTWSVNVLTTNRKLRDTNGWYHLVLQVDSTNSTADDRVKMWINGVQETSFSTRNNPSSSQAFSVNDSASTHTIGAGNQGSGRNQYFDGYMSHFVLVDGSVVAPTAFGQTDATSGIWKFKSPSGVTFGTNGVHLKFENSGALGTDSSGNSNTYAVNGSLRQALDTPSNSYCLINRLQEPRYNQNATMTFGNTKIQGNGSNWQRVYGSLGARQGKWYYEFKNLNDDGNSGQCRLGWDSVDFINMGTDNYYSGLTLDRAGKLRGGESGHNAYDPNNVQMTAAYSGGNFTYTANDILGMAIDIDNNTFSVYKNGNLEINAYSYASNSNCSLLKSKGHFIAPSWNFYSASGNANRSCFNFGNGYFETTAITSAGANGNGSLFEYDVPSGYYAWNTENINTYG